MKRFSFHLCFQNLVFILDLCRVVTKDLIEFRSANKRMSMLYTLKKLNKSLYVHKLVQVSWVTPLLMKPINRSKMSSDLDLTNNLIQISMDGPNVNWAAIKIIDENRKLDDPDAHDLLGIGSCGLHVLHGAY